MFFLLLILWVIFNGRLASDVLITGVALSAAITWFAMRFCRWHITKTWKWRQFLPAMLSYCGLLVKEIIKSNLDVIRLILSPGLEKKIHPQLVKMEVDLKNPFTRMLLANSITLTPSTITVRMHPDTYVIHALTPDMAVNQDLPFLIACREMEKTMGEAPAEKEEADHV